MQIVTDPELCESGFRSRILSFLKNLAIAPEVEWVTPETRSESSSAPEPILEQASTKNAAPDAIVDGLRIYKVESGDRLFSLFKILTGREHAPRNWLAAYEDPEDVDAELLNRWQRTGQVLRFYLVADEKELYLLGQIGTRKPNWHNYPGDDPPDFQITADQLPTFTPLVIEKKQRAKQFQGLIKAEDTQGIKNLFAPISESEIRSLLSEHLETLTKHPPVLLALFDLDPELFRSAFEPFDLLYDAFSLQMLEFYTKRVGIPWETIIASHGFHKIIKNQDTYNDTKGFQQVIKIMKEETSENLWSLAFTNILELLDFDTHFLPILQTEFAGFPWVISAVKDLFNIPGIRDLTKIRVFYPALVHKRFPMSEIDRAFGGSLISTWVSFHIKSVRGINFDNFDFLVKFITNELLDEGAETASPTGDLYLWLSELLLSPDAQKETRLALALLLPLVRKLKSQGYDFSPPGTIPFTAVLKNSGLLVYEEAREMYQLLIRDERIRMGSLLTLDDELSEQRIEEARGAKINYDKPVLIKQVGEYKAYRIWNQAAFQSLVEKYPVISKWTIVSIYDHNQWGGACYLITQIGCRRAWFIFSYSSPLRTMDAVRVTPLTKRAGFLVRDGGRSLKDLLGTLGFSQDDFPYFIAGDPPDENKTKQLRVRSLIRTGTDTETLKAALRGIRYEDWTVGGHLLEEALMQTAPAEQIALLVQRGFAEDTPSHAGVFHLVSDPRTLALLRKTRFWQDVLHLISVQYPAKMESFAITLGQGKPEPEILMMKLAELYGPEVSLVPYPLILRRIATNKATRDLIYPFFARIFAQNPEFWSQQTEDRVYFFDPNFLVYLYKQGIRIVTPQQVLSRLYSWWLNTDSLVDDRSYIKNTKWWISEFGDQMTASDLMEKLVSAVPMLKAPLQPEMYSIFVEILKKRPSLYTEKAPVRTVLQILSSREEWFEGLENGKQKWAQLVHQGRLRSGTLLTQDDMIDENRRHRK